MKRQRWRRPYSRKRVARPVGVPFLGVKVGNLCHGDEVPFDVDDAGAQRRREAAEKYRRSVSGSCWWLTHHPSERYFYRERVREKAQPLPLCVMHGRCSDPASRQRVELHEADSAAAPDRDLSVQPD